MTEHSLHTAASFGYYPYPNYIIRSGALLAGN